MLIRCAHAKYVCTVSQKCTVDDFELSILSKCLFAQRNKVYRNLFAIRKELHLMEDQKPSV